MKNLLPVFALLVLFACNNNHAPKKEATQTASPKEIAFKKLVARQKLIDLPLYFDVDNISDSLTQPNIVDDSDTLIFQPDHTGGNRMWGLYKDTTNYFLFVQLMAAERYTPGIIVFDKQGNEIGLEQFIVHGCGFDCGYFCSEKSRLYKDASSNKLMFLVRDSVNMYYCDSLGKETPGTRQHYVKTKLGVIDITGHITTDTITQFIKP
jgi:hypothetical protein